MLLCCSRDSGCSTSKLFGLLRRRSTNPLYCEDYPPFVALKISVAYIYQSTFVLLWVRKFVRVHHTPVADPASLEMEQSLQSLAEERTRFALLKPAPVGHRVKNLASVVKRRHDVKVVLIPERLNGA